PEELFAPDQVAYHIFGERLSRYWTGDLLVFPGFPAGPTGYYYVVAALYTVFGAWPLVVKLANCVVGAVTILLVYDLALKVTGSNAAAFRAARYTAYFPSLILWSTLNIRDCWVV